jgi:hypothetical protein
MDLHYVLTGSVSCRPWYVWRNYVCKITKCVTAWPYCKAKCCELRPLSRLATSLCDVRGSPNRGGRLDFMNRKSPTMKPRKISFLNIKVYRLKRKRIFERTHPLRVWKQEHPTRYSGLLGRFGRVVRDGFVLTGLTITSYTFIHFDKLFVNVM